MAHIAPRPDRMTIKRLLAFQLLLAGLGGIYVFPAATQHQPCGVVMSLPEQIGDWTGKDAEVTQRERDILGPETEFVRKTYEDFWGDRALVSIVLSGHDMNQSIHRPERCLPTQNFTIQGSSTLPIALSDSKKLTVTRLYVTRPAPLRSGGSILVPSVNYYWFIGSTETTPSHYEREFLDMRDGILKGYNQRWAYVTVMADITEGIKMGGLTEKETDKLVQGLISKIVPAVEKPGVINR